MLRRLCALVLAALVLLEGAGVARALAGSVEFIQCCCGRHDSHRACRCKACPVSKRRARATTTRLDSSSSCDGQSDPGVLAVTAIPVADEVAVEVLTSAIEFVPPRVLTGRILEAGRPPP